MTSIGTPTLDQVEVFLAVVEHEGFTAAARRLNRATSAITYAIDQLEFQLGVTLFERGASRRPELTEVGRAVLLEARTIHHSVEALKARIKGLTEGFEAEVSLAVDVMFPTRRLVDALQGFQAEFPNIPLRLHVEALGAVSQLVIDGAAGLGVSGPLSRNVEGLEHHGVGSVILVPVAAPHHPLARSTAAHAPGDARNHIQLVLTDRSPLTRGQDFGVIGTKTWRLADLGAKHALLLAGTGWGSMPEFMIGNDLEAGRLVRLALPDWAAGTYAFNCVYRPDSPPGPATRWLIDRFASQ